MSNRVWLPSPPIGAGIGILLLFVLAGLANQYHQTQSSQYSSTEKYEQTKQIGPMGAAPQGPQTEPKAYREEWRSERDLEAQWKMADWTEVGVVATWLGIFFVVVTLWYTRIGVSAAVEAAAVAQTTADRELRAYLSLKPSMMNFNGTTPLDITVVIENHGQTPASRVVHFVAVHFPDYPLPHGYDPGDPGDGVSTQGVWPGALFPFKRDLGRPVAPELLQHLQAGTKRLVVFSLVRYQDVFGRPHYTKLCASLDWRQLTTAPRTLDPATGRQAFTFVWEYEHQHNDFD